MTERQPADYERGRADERDAIVGWLDRMGYNVTAQKLALGMHLVRAGDEGYDPTDAGWRRKQ